MNSFMQQALEEALAGSQANDGGPFGAVICRQGQIIARGHNEVVKNNDPTAHAEIVAIRKASAAMGRFDLSDCELYTSCEPCPMCLAAIYWARIPRVYFGCDKQDAANIGFDDEKIYDFLAQPERSTEGPQLIPLDRDRCLQAFEAWQLKPDRTMY